jgi:hypothetical protein
MDIQSLTLPQIEYQITVARKAVSDCELRIKNYPKVKMGTDGVRELDGFKKNYEALQKAMQARYRKS